MDEVRVRVVRVLCSQSESRPGPGHEIGDGDRGLPAGHQPQLLRLVHDLLERDVEQRGNLVFDNRPVSRQRRARREAGERLLRDRRVEDAGIAELCGQPLRDAAERVTDVFADDEHLLVTCHLVAQRLRQRSLVSQERHQRDPLRTGIGLA